MPQMIVSVSHPLDQEEATARLNKKLLEIKEKHQYEVRDLIETRPDPHTLKFSFKAFGFGVSGICESKPGEVRMDLDLPFAAMVIRGMIESQVKSELKAVLA